MSYLRHKCHLHPHGLLLDKVANSWRLAAFLKGFPGGTGIKETACQCRRGRFDPGAGRSPGGGHGCPLLYACLENPMDRGAWRATVHGVTKNWTRLKQLSKHTHSLHDIEPQNKVSYPAPGSAGQAGSASMEMDSYEHLIPKRGLRGLPCLFSPQHQLENHPSFPREAWKEDQEDGDCLVSTLHIKGNIRNGEGAPQVWVHHDFYNQPLWDIWLVSNHSIISQIILSGHNWGGHGNPLQ